MDLKERLRWVMEQTGLSGRDWATKAGLGHGYVNDLIKRRDPEPDTEKLTKLAKVAGVNAAWLIEGKGPHGLTAKPKAPEPSPAPPPATGPRAKQARGDEDETVPDEVEEMAWELAQRPDAPRYTFAEMKAAKIFVHTAASRLRPGVTRLDLLASAAEAARELTAAGEVPSAGGILEVLLAKNTPKYAAPKPEDETPFQRRLREAREANEREGLSQKPAKPVDATTSKRSKSS